MEILQRALREALDRNAAETVRWTRYKEQHEGAKANIEEFTKSLEVDIMVPIGSKALMPGRLYHTNEIVVSHSRTYYSKCSAHKALEICQNRLNLAANRLNDLETEANLHKNQLELPMDFDAFSSQEIIETYDEEEEQKWQADHKKKMKEHKRKEALERQNLMNGKDEDEVMKRLELLEMMEELENELEAISEEDDEAVQAILNEKVEPVSNKRRISHFKQHNNEPVFSSIDDKENVSSSDDNDEDDDDDDIPAEIKELEHRTASMTKGEKLKQFKIKLDEVQEYVQSMRPRTLEEISHKTDMMFLSDHLTSAIESMEDEINCDQYLNGEFSDSAPRPNVTNVPKQTKTILKKRKKVTYADESLNRISEPISTKKIAFPSEDDDKLFDSDEPNKRSTKKISFALEHEVKPFNIWEEPSKISSTVIYTKRKKVSYADESLDREPISTTKISFAAEDDESLNRINEPISTKKIAFPSEDDDKSFDSNEPSKRSTKKISFALEDDVKSFDMWEEPSKISSTVIYDHGPVLSLNINHSDAVFNETNEQSDVIRSPVDIYKQFAACTINEDEQSRSVVTKSEFKKPATKKSSTQGVVDQTKAQPWLQVIENKPKTQSKPPKTVEEPKDVAEAKKEVKEMLDGMFGSKNPNEPDPLPEGHFVDAHQPKKRVSLFKQRRQMKSQ